MEEKSSNAEANKNVNNMRGDTKSLEIGEKCDVSTLFKNQNNGTVNQYNIVIHNSYYLNEGHKNEKVQEIKPIVENRSRLKEMGKLIMDCGRKELIKRLFDSVIDHRDEIAHFVWCFFSLGINYKIWIITSIITLAFYFLKNSGIE